MISANDAKRAARNVGALMLASILSKGILFLWQLLLTNLISTVDYGVYTTILGIYAITAPIVTLGMGLIAIREIAKNPEKIRQYASAMLFSQTALSGIAYLVLVAFAYLSNFSDTIIVFTAIAGISLVIDVFGTVGNDLLIAQEEMRITSIIEIAQILFRLGLTIVALWLGWGLFGIYAATLIIGLARSIVIWLIHWRRGLIPEFPLEWREIALPMLINALPLAGAAMLSLGYDHSDKLMITSFLGEEQTAYLGPAFFIHFGIIELLSTTVLVAIYPLLSRYYADGKNEIFGFLAEVLARFMLLIAVPMAIIVSLFAPQLIFFLPAEYAPTASILQIFIWYTLLTMIANVFSSSMLIQNQQGYTLFVRGAALSLNLILNAILLFQYRDPRGAVIASVAAEALVLILFIFKFRAKGFIWNRFFSAAGRIIVLGFITALIMIIVGQVFWLLGLISGVIVYLLGAIFGHVLREEDWDFLYRLSAAMPFGKVLHRYWKRETAINF